MNLLVLESLTPSRARWFLSAVAVAALVCIIPWIRLSDNFRQRRAELAKLKPLLKAAQERSLDYDSVLGHPNETQGAPVVWCIDHPSTGVSYVNGRPRQKIYWRDESQIPIVRLTKDRCVPIAAIVREIRPDGIVLEYQGRP